MNDKNNKIDKESYDGDASLEEGCYREFYFYFEKMSLEDKRKVFDKIKELSSFEDLLGLEGV